MTGLAKEKITVGAAFYLTLSFLKGFISWESRGFNDQGGADMNKISLIYKSEIFAKSHKFLAIVFSLSMILAYSVVVRVDAADSMPAAAVLTALEDGQFRALITQSVDENALVELKGNKRPEATFENDRGAVADDFPMEHMLLLLKRAPEQEKALQQLIGDLHDLSSQYFHQWLTAQQFGQTFGLALQDLDTITGWLESHGFTVNEIYPSGLLIDFSGSAAQVREAFRTEIHYLEVKGEWHTANMSDPQIPTALAPAVIGVVSLHDFRPRIMHKMRGEYTFSSGGSVFQTVTPSDLATIYNLTPLFTAGISGQGQTIAVIEDSNVYNTADWNTFRSTFGLSGYTSGSFMQAHPAPPSGSNNCINPGVNGDEGEAILDAEYASAAAPNAAIELASCANTASTFGGLIAMQNLINGNRPPAIISISYGECEAGNGATANAAYNATYQQAAVEGVSVFVAAGDEGAASCDAGSLAATHGIGVSGLASTPYNVAVGGTDFGDTYSGTNSAYWSPTNSPSYGSALSYIPEIPWNDSCASVLIASYLGFGTTYGSNGLCNSSIASFYGLLTTVSGSGGPSGCATGVPSTSGVVSGSCAGYAKPSWQSIVGNPNDGVRDIPDVSLFSANGVWGHYYIYCDSDTADGGAPCTGAPSGWSGAGGTSFASPIMAGIQALVNQETGSPQGYPNPVYYQLAANEYGQSGNAACNSSLGSAVNSPCIFYDVTQGDMDVNCKGSYSCYLPSGSMGVLSTSSAAYQKAFGTAVGWDFATGIGTVNAYNLVSNWPASLTAPSTPTAVIAVAGNAQATVSFMAPISNGGSPITLYTVTSNPATITASGPSSPITVSGLSNGTTYNFTVTATNAVGTSLPSAPSNSVTPSAITYSISGTVRTATGTAISGVTMTLSGASSGTTTTDASGNYIFTGLVNGTYTVTPSLSGYTFSPTSITITINNGNITGRNFTGTFVTYSISGKVTTSRGSAISSVTITLSGAKTGTTKTNSAGNYSFSKLANGSYTITPSRYRYTFSPTSITVNIDNANVTGQNFTGTRH